MSELCPPLAEERLRALGPLELAQVRGRDGERRLVLLPERGQGR